ncbi:hypothetical protein RGUI_0885 [Rhodovulum sp. P5]|uniref:DUF1868 domain-containing protein n=1 Tax=Rhodovulum sp. P5 TaxID=1564506 RepID=UPI0009C3C3BE|nr:DUF1868 domain-containing protein [Rhodovulum sp. P5]ARE39026.1 hypothetical protein RGUI_0885 [Rhodovulum sp. P5]
MTNAPDMALGRDAALTYLTGGMAEGAVRPRHLGEKFTPDGAPLPFPGNTTLCHLDPQSAAHAAVTHAQAQLRSGPLADSFAFLPPASFHMTVFEGVNDAHRVPERWPADLSLGTPLGDVTQHFETALAACDLPQRFTISPLELFAGFAISVTGATAPDLRTMRAARDRMSAALHLRRPDHDRYRFHITLAYPLRWFNADEASAIVDLCEEIFAGLAPAMGTVPLGPIAFCQFETMHRFDPLRLLT